MPNHGWMMLITFRQLSLACPVNSSGMELLTKPCRLIIPHLFIIYFADNFEQTSESSFSFAETELFMHQTPDDTNKHWGENTEMGKGWAGSSYNLYNQGHCQ